ncbi:trypsin beta-like [Onthophagus taurus]|uniref:trypsin beta-like n=1 Tax=Onthophagus taurus TaxID=166361 RepID=UPI000C20373A|nr:trypsin beta-like [Onthophagus taurus]
MKFILLLAAVLGCALAYPAAEDRVVGGSNAARNQFPYQASMQWGLLGIWQHVCGGTIISARTVLTAAHCITEVPNIGSFRIRAGILLLNDATTIGQTITVSSNVIHPDYQGGVNPHDIALLRLANGLAFGASIAAAPLPAAGSVPSGVATLSGWGSTSSTQIPSMPNTLQFVNTPLITIALCRSSLISILGNAGPLHNNNVCTLGAGQSACSGDSGGPLTLNGAVIGVVSWGIMPCATPGAPSVYGRVSAYNGWINSNIL